MAFIPVPNVMSLEMRYTLGGSQIENRIMVGNLAPITAADLEAVAIQGWNWAESVLLPHLSSTLHLVETVATDLTTNESGQFTYAPDTTTNGGQSGACLPNECAFCISLHSAERGRSARGRMFLPAIPVAVMADSNHLDGTSAGILVSDVQSLINTLGSTTRKPVIVSYRHDKVLRPGGPVEFVITGAVATDTVIDSMKRRKPGVGI